MPGISLLISLNNNSREYKSKFEMAQKSMQHNQDYTSNIIFLDNTCFLGHTKYKEYPVNVFETEKYLIVIEGRIYNKTLKIIKSELVGILKLSPSNKNKINNALQKWILGSDGDFIVLLFDKRKNKINIFNDALGRLPIYYYWDKNLFLLSREVKFLTHFIKDVTLDKLAIAEYLLFTYPIGKRTLVDKICRLAPATILDIKIDTPDIKITKIYSFNFDDKQNSGKSIKEQTCELERLFLSACKSRADFSEDFGNVISLSGGLDSRIVAAGLKKIDAPMVGATFLDFDGKMNEDAVIAKKVANVLGINWKLFNLKDPDLADFEYLIHLQDGLSHVGLSNILQFFRQIKATFGDKVLYFTGDEGNLTMPDLRPRTQLKNVNELVDYILANNALFNLDQIEALTGTDKLKIKTDIKKRLEEYPERDLHQKYVHFLIFEYGFKRQFESEDRNRMYFWTVAPMYSLFFFQYLMNIPDQQKRFYKLYKRFLTNLAPECAMINNANWNAPIKRYLVFSIKELIKKYLRDIVRERRGDIVSVSNDKINKLKKYILKYLETSSTSTYLAESGVRQLVNGNCDEGQLYPILTILGYISMLEGHKKRILVIK